MRTAPLARLAYNGGDGFPRVIPCGFFWNGDAIVVCTAATAPKRAPCASVQTSPLPSTAAHPQARRQSSSGGIAQLDTVDGVADECLEAATKTMQGF
jgi:hypothetical protein